MENTKSVKSLKKQLMAAIAMVMVAAIALGSSTYAWFVTNNEVKATTSTISAQSNAAFMVIKYGDSAITSDLMADSATIGDTPLYPAQWNTTGGKFETAYAQTVSAATMKADSLKVIGTGGTPAEAVTDKYAIVNTFNISAKGTNLTNLTVSGADIKTAGNTHLDDALRVLVVSPTGWVLCDKAGVVASESDTSGLLGDTITAGEDTEVNLYVYYDGNAEEIYTNNLANLKDASSTITVTFTATADNH